MVAAVLARFNWTAVPAWCSPAFVVVGAAWKFWKRLGEKLHEVRAAVETVKRMDVRLSTLEQTVAQGARASTSAASAAATTAAATAEKVDKLLGGQ